MALSIVLPAINIAKDAFSVSSLALAFVFVRSGGLFASAVVLVLAVTSWAGAVLLDTTSARKGLARAPSFSHAVERVFGSRAKTATDLLIVAVDTAASVAMLIAAGESLQESARRHGTPDWLASFTYAEWVVAAGALVLIICLLLPDGDMLKYPSALGSVCFVALVAVVAVIGAQGLFDHSRKADTRDDPRSDLGPSSFESAILAPGIVKFCFAGIESWPSLATPLGARYQRTLALAIGIMFVFTMAMGIEGFLFLGPNVSDNILLELPHSALGSIACAVTALMLVMTTPILLFAAFEILETRWAMRDVQRATAMQAPLLVNEKGDGMPVDAADAPSPVAASRLAVSLIRTAVVTVAVVPAAVYPDLAKAVSVTGAVGDGLLGLVIPGAMALASRQHMPLGAVLILVGVACMVCGLVVPFL